MSTKQAKQAANNRWNKKTYDAITLRLKKGEKDIIAEHIKTTGESMNAFFVRAIMTQIGLDIQSNAESNTPQETPNETPTESSENTN